MNRQFHSVKSRSSLRAYASFSFFSGLWSSWSRSKFASNSENHKIATLQKKSAQWQWDSNQRSCWTQLSTLHAQLLSFLLLHVVVLRNLFCLRRFAQQYKVSWKNGIKLHCVREALSDKTTHFVFVSWFMCDNNN